MKINRLIYIQKQYLNTNSKILARNVDKRNVNLGGDSRYTLMKGALYESKHRSVPAIPNEELERRQVVEKVWAVEKNREAFEITSGHKRRFERMYKAMSLLKDLDLHLYNEANAKPETQMFPKTLNIPTEAVGKLGFPEYPQIKKSE